MSLLKLVHRPASSYEAAAAKANGRLRDEDLERVMIEIANLCCGGSCRGPAYMGGDRESARLLWLELESQGARCGRLKLEVEAVADQGEGNRLDKRSTVEECACVCARQVRPSISGAAGPS